MPEGWEAKAKELGALKRAREIKTPEELLRLIFLYLTRGRSFAGTSAIIQIAEEYKLNKIAVWKRIKNSAEWLEWLCKTILRQAGLLAEKPAWLAGKTVGLVDASEVVLHGSHKKYYLLHYCLDLFTLAMRELKITDMKNGEKLRNFERFEEGSIVLGDRAYGTIPGIPAGAGNGLCVKIAVRGVYPV